jgi:hypothetical protein
MASKSIYNFAGQNTNAFSGMNVPASWQQPTYGRPQRPPMQYGTTQAMAAPPAVKRDKNAPPQGHTSANGAWADYMAPVNEGRTWGDTQRRFGHIQTGATNASNLALRQLLPELQNMGELQQDRMGLIRELLAQLSGQGRQANLARFGAQARGNAASSSPLAAALLRSNNASRATQNAAHVNAINNANKATNDYAMQQFSPEQIANLASLIMQHQQAPSLQGYNALASLGYSRHYNTEPKEGGGGLLGTLGQVAGMGTGLGFDWGQVFSKGRSNPVTHP